MKHAQRSLALTVETKESGARFSEDHRFRFSLFRSPIIGPRRHNQTPITIVWDMLNPSKADGDADDPTIRRVCSFSVALARLLHGPSYLDRGVRAVVVNLSPLVSTSPVALREVTAWLDSVEENRREVAATFERASAIVLAWGAHGAEVADERAHHLALLFDVDRITAPIYCLGVTASGDPRHPVRLANATTFETWVKK